VWCLRPAPPFWPEPGEMGEACEDHEVGPWLDFEDMFLTSRVLMRALSELVGLLGALAGLLPEEETGGCRRRISGTAQAAGLREAAAAAAARRAPWLRASPCEAPTARQELVAPPLSEAQAALDRALWSEATALVRSSLKSRGRAARCIQRAFRARAAHRADGPAAPSPSGEAPSIPSSAGAARAPSGGTKNNIIIEARRSARTPEFLCLCRPSLPYPRTLARRARRPLCARAAPRPTARLSGRSIAGQGGRGAPACGPAPRRRRPWTARNDRGEDSGTPELGLAGALCRARPGRRRRKRGFSGLPRTSRSLSRPRCARRHLGPAPPRRAATPPAGRAVPLRGARWPGGDAEELAVAASSARCLPAARARSSSEPRDHQGCIWCITNLNHF
ncbi:unnamed protein product, partial [Prorocentrum cordatum]